MMILTYFHPIRKILIDLNNCEPYLPVTTRDSKARSCSCYSDDISITEGTKLFSKVSSDRFQQFINE